MHQIVAGQDLQRGLVNDPLGHDLFRHAPGQFPECYSTHGSSKP
jgi:hypothetical protein